MTNEEFAAMLAEGACGTEEVPCVVELKSGQWQHTKEAIAAAVTALGVLTLVGLSALIGSWGRRGR